MKYVIHFFLLCSLAVASFADKIENVFPEDSELRLDFEALVSDLSNVYTKVFVTSKGTEQLPVPGIALSVEDIQDLRDLHRVIETLSKEKGWDNFRCSIAIDQPGFEDRYDIIGVTYYLHDSEPSARQNLRKAKRFKLKHPELF